MGGQRDGRIVEGVPRLGFIRRAPAAAAAALRREITRGSLKTCRKSEVRLECSPGISTYACGSADVRVYVRLKKDHEGGGDAEEAEERGPNRAYVCAARCACARVFEEKHISLLLLPPSLFFLPADLHSRWVGLLLLPVCLFLSLFSQRVSLPLLSSPPRNNGKDSTPNARCSLFTRASPREIAWRAQQRAREPRKRSASIKRSPSLAPPLVSPLSSLSPSMIERRLLLQL